MCWAASDVLAFEKVTRVFRGGAGVADLTFAIEPGEVVALIGLNGAGKTTLMRLALGMLRPQQGMVNALGHPLDAVPAEAWCQVGALIEVPLAYPELTVRKNLHIACLLRHASPDRVRSLSTRGVSIRWLIVGSVACRSETANVSAWPPRCSTIPGSSCWTNPATRSTLPP